MYTQRLSVTWEKQGQVRWNDDWIEARGYTRSHVPNLDDHLGFVNYDLNRQGLPSVRREGGGLVIDVDLVRVSGLPANAGPLILHSRAVARIQPILEYHGFRLK